jgi:transposase-like protein
MTCHNCKIKCQRFGKDRKGNQRFRCCQRYKTYSERPEKLDGTYLPTEKITQIIRLLVEGCSVRSIERVTGIHRDTILNVLMLAGERCERLLVSKIQGLPVNDVQYDEIWGFVGCKEKRNVSGDPTLGDGYCFVAIERNTKQVLTWHLRKRTARDTFAFTEKINEARQGQFQITTDGFKPYFDAVHHSLGTRVDFAQLVKVYAAPRDGEQRYSPSEVVDTVPLPRWGQPKLNRICTSHVERQNLSIRMGMRRMTRLTNAFSKKWENHYAALSLYFAYYDFVRIHSSIRVTPAMETGITDHVWTLEELLGNI